MSYLSALHRIDRERELYVFKHDRGDEAGYTCLGFQVAYDRAQALHDELAACGADVEGLAPKTQGTKATLRRYDALLAIAQAKNKDSGWTSQSQLTGQLIGLEGRRVRVLDAYGQRRTFRVARSMGVTPIHLEYERGDGLGGFPVTGAPFKRVLPLTG